MDWLHLLLWAAGIPLCYTCILVAGTEDGWLPCTVSVLMWPIMGILSLFATLYIFLTVKDEPKD